MLWPEWLHGEGGTGCAKMHVVEIKRDNLITMIIAPVKFDGSWCDNYQK